MYNNELLEHATKREIKEKTNLKNISLKMNKVFDNITRSPLRHMIGINYIGLVDIDKVRIMKKTVMPQWVSIDSIPSLAYEHNEILSSSIDKLKQLILPSDILKKFYPNRFTLPGIHKVYESILGITIDRRNFRKKLLSSNLIIDSNKTVNFIGKRPAKVYEFNANIKNKRIF